MNIYYEFNALLARCKIRKPKTDIDTNYKDK